jgi:EAL domain-containing protein (putative c-di-GMP-specific phosphodiesterase class I)
MLAAAGCDELQGFLFSPPLSVLDFMMWVDARDQTFKRFGQSNHER